MRWRTGGRGGGQVGKRWKTFSGESRTCWSEVEDTWKGMEEMWRTGRKVAKDRWKRGGGQVEERQKKGNEAMR